MSLATAGSEKNALIKSSMYVGMIRQRAARGLVNVKLQLH